jgi:serine/threonine protein kinase
MSALLLALTDFQALGETPAKRPFRFPQSEYCAAMASNIPAKVGKYDVIDLIGRGGMGVVYKAVDPHLDRQVAIKMMTGGFTDNPDLLKRFFREAQSLGSLQHPNIVTVYDLGDFNGNPYMVMEYMEGEGLDSVLANRRQLSLLEKTNIIIQVCHGLSYAHGRGIVHRDIKPANIMVGKDGGIKLFDFGIAHIGDHSVTKTGQIVGTLSYMSPEQVNGKPVDARTDLFSTGVVLYQLFTNHLPFEGESTATTLLKIIYDPPPPLKNFLSSYPPELEAILLRALAKDREERYHSADEFALDLSQLQVQLKQELISQHMQEVGQLLERADLYKAKEYLLQVLRIDQQHIKATQLLREVQARIKKEEVGEQVRKLRQRAEEAAGREQFDTAQEYVDQALAIDKTNTELIRLRETIKAAAVRAQKLHNALRLAETSHQDGDLDTAKQAVEEALQVAPDDAQAKALHRVIQRDWVERSRQRQLENYLFEARQDISSRKFTAALEILKLAEDLDPKAPQVHALIESAMAGRDQERRRKDLEAISRGIEDALNRDDYRAACQKADEGLARFPDERTLVKLKALAERQRQIEERKQLIDEQLAVARTLLQEGRNEELLTALDAAIAKIGPEPRLQSLLTIVTENVQRERLERRKNEFLQKAKEFLRGKRFDSAIETLESARTELKNEPEIDDLLQFVREEAASDQRRRVAEAAAEKAHAFVAEQKYDEAIRLLETALRDAPDEELKIVLAETRKGAVEYQQRLEATVSSAEKLLQARKANEALKLLESQPAAYFRNPSLSKLVETARRETERLGKIDEAISQSRRILDEEDFAGARRVLEECRRLNGTSPELDVQLAAIAERRIASASRNVEKVIADARVLTMAAEYQAALDKLQTVSELANEVPVALRSDYRALQQQNTAGLIHTRKNQIERFVAAGDLTRAAELLRQSLDQFPGERELASLGNALNQETARRTEAKDKLAEAQKAFGRGRWQEGGEFLQKAFAASARAPQTREQILQAFVQAGISAVEADWRAAESLLQQLADLKSDYAPPSVLRSRIRERKREEAISQCAAQAKRLLATGELQEAVRTVNGGITSYPDEASLKELQNRILERIQQEEDRARQLRAQQEKEDYLREISSRADRERALDRRITIFEEALARHPQERRLEQLLNSTRELWKRVSGIAERAEALELACKFDEALVEWHNLRTVYREYPDLEGNIARLARLRDQSRAAEKANFLAELQDALASSELDRARALLLEARQKLLADRELSRVEDQLSDALKARGKAQKFLTDSGKSFEQSRWQKGAEVAARALEAASGDAVVRDRVLAQLARACESALPVDLEAAQMLAGRLSAIAPRSPYLHGLRSKIDDRRRELAVLEKLASARRAQQSDDLQGALRELALGLAAYPADQRLMQAKSDIDIQLKHLEELRKREREKARQLELEREQIRKEEEERKRKEAVERERLRAEEEERKQRGAAERERIRAEEAERKRLEALERERIRAEEEERRRKEDLERERQLAIQREQERERERKRLAALEQERAKADAEAREQARLREIELERQREEERQRQLELEAERQAAEKRRLEEAQRLRDEEARKEEERRQQRELARQQQKEQKERDKVRKREERERKQAAQEEQRRKQQEAQQKREEQARLEAQRVKEAKSSRKKEKEPSTEIRPAEQPDVSATRLFGSPSDASASAEVEQLEEVAKQQSSKERARKIAASLDKRPVVLVGASIALVVLILIGRWLMQPRSIPIQITTSVDGADVIVSAVGENAPKKSCVTPCALNLPAGKFSVHAAHEGYQPTQQTIEISANGRHLFPLDLMPNAPPPPPPSSTSPSVTSLSLAQFGRLELRGVPSGELFVDGGSAGKVGRNGEISTKLPAGPHQIKIVANGKTSSIVSRNFEAGRVVSLGKDDFYPSTPPSPEEVAWQSALTSPSIESVEQFLQKYQNGSHSTEARAMLENLYWKRDSQTDTADSYRDYLRRYADGPHAAAASKSIEDLKRVEDQAKENQRFQEALNSSDEATLRAFLNQHPSGPQHDQIYGRLDDVMWGKTQTNDVASLRAYVEKMSDGKYVSQAREGIEKLTEAAKPSKAPTPTPEPRLTTPVTPRTVDDQQAILSVLEQYKKAYEDENVDDLVKLAPGTGDRKGFDLFFRKTSSVKWQYLLRGNPQINGDRATVRFEEILSYVLDKRPIKQQKSTTMSFKKQASGNWVIESIQRN